MVVEEFHERHAVRLALSQDYLTKSLEIRLARQKTVSPS